MNRTLLAIGLAMLAVLAIWLGIRSREAPVDQTVSPSNQISKTSAPLEPMKLEAESTPDASARTSAAPAVATAPRSVVGASTAPAALVSGTVVDETGAPVVGAFVTAEASGIGAFDENYRRLEAHAGTKGEFLISGSLAGDQIQLVAALGDRHTPPLVVDAGASEVRLVLERCGSLVSVMRHPGASTNLDLDFLLLAPGKDEPVGVFRSAAGQNKGLDFVADGDASASSTSFRFPCLMSGSYTLEVFLSGEDEEVHASGAPLISVKDIAVKGGVENRDPRLDPLDLRDFVHAHSIRFIDGKDRPIAVGDADITDAVRPGKVRHLSIESGALHFFSRSAVVDGEFRAPGGPSVHAQVGSDPQVIRLERGIIVEVRFTGLELPKPPSRLRVVFVTEAEEKKYPQSTGSRQWILDGGVFNDAEVLKHIALQMHEAFLRSFDVNPQGIAAVPVEATGLHFLHAFLFSQPEGSTTMTITELQLNPHPQVTIEDGESEQVIPIQLDPTLLDNIANHK